MGLSFVKGAEGTVCATYSEYDKIISGRRKQLTSFRNNAVKIKEMRV
jgi:hypothetical protein